MQSQQPFGANHIYLELGEKTTLARSIMAIGLLIIYMYIYLNKNLRLQTIRCVAL